MHSPILENMFLVSFLKLQQNPVEELSPRLNPRDRFVEEAYSAHMLSGLNLREVPQHLEVLFTVLDSGPAHGRGNLPFLNANTAGRIGLSNKF